MIFRQDEFFGFRTIGRHLVVICVGTVVWEPLNLFLNKWFGRFSVMTLFDRKPQSENNVAWNAPFEKSLTMDYYRAVNQRQFRTYPSCFVDGGCLCET